PCVVRPDHPSERRAGMHACTERDPRPIRRPVAGDAEQLLGGFDRARGMFRAGQEGDEQTNDLVAHELLDDRVTLDQDAARLAVEAVHQPREVDHRHLPCELARPSDIREEHRDLNFAPADLLARGGAWTHLGVLPDALETPPADPRLLRPWRVSISRQDELAG